VYIKNLNTLLATCFKKDTGTVTEYSQKIIKNAELTEISYQYKLPFGIAIASVDSI